MSMSGNMSPINTVQDQSNQQNQNQNNQQQNNQNQQQQPFSISMTGFSDATLANLAAAAQGTMSPVQQQQQQLVNNFAQMQNDLRQMMVTSNNNGDGNNSNQNNNNNMPQSPQGINRMQQANQSGQQVALNFLTNSGPANSGITTLNTNQNQNNVNLGYMSPLGQLSPGCMSPLGPQQHQISSGGGNGAGGVPEGQLNLSNPQLNSVPLPPGSRLALERLNQNNQNQVSVNQVQQQPQSSGPFSPLMITISPGRGPQDSNNNNNVVGQNNINNNNNNGMNNVNINNSGSYISPILSPIHNGTNTGITSPTTQSQILSNLLGIPDNRNQNQGPITISSTAMTAVGTVPLVQVPQSPTMSHQGDDNNRGSSTNNAGNLITRFPSLEEYSSFLQRMLEMKNRNPDAFQHVHLPEGIVLNSNGRRGTSMRIDGLYQSEDYRDLTSNMGFGSRSGSKDGNNNNSNMGSGLRDTNNNNADNLNNSMSGGNNNNMNNNNNNRTGNNNQNQKNNYGTSTYGGASGSNHGAGNNNNSSYNNSSRSGGDNQSQTGNNNNNNSSNANSTSSDNRTTMMLRNIPNKYTQAMLLKTLDDTGFFRCYDFFYLPIDFKNRCNVGYAFINFTTAAHAKRFLDTFHRYKLKAYNSPKVCEVNYARVQGLDNNIQVYRNSPVNGIPIEQYRPLIFDGFGNKLVFPQPDAPLPPIQLKDNSSMTSGGDRGGGQGPQGGVGGSNNNNSITSSSGVGGLNNSMNSGGTVQTGAVGVVSGVGGDQPNYSEYYGGGW